jgi:predicted DNA-binding protein (UPF0251 family)
MPQVHSKENTTIAVEHALYATKSDFCKVFAEDMNSLYLLSLLLTADPAKAEQCFVSGLDDCADGNQVFKEWAHSWARRAIIKNAIRLIAPDAANFSTERNGFRRDKNAFSDQPRAEFKVDMAALLELDHFERFAFVMSVLEGYSDRECALLLGCTRDTLIEARSRALQQVAQLVGEEAERRIEKEPAETSGRSILAFKALAPLATPA